LTAVDFTVRRIEPSDQTQDFDCGNGSLNEYLRKYARQDQRRMFGVTYVAVSSHNAPNRVIGYFTLAATAIPRAGLPENLLRGVPKYRDLPAFLLARLAVGHPYHGKRIGEVLLSKCFEHCLAVSKLCGARYLVADAKETAVSWYERYNFRRIAGSTDAETTKMLVDLEVVRSAIEVRGPAM